MNRGNRVFQTANYYDVLGVGCSASAREITDSYKKLQQRHHPDKGGDKNISVLLNEAKRILLDPELRAHYNTTGSSVLNKNNHLPPTHKLSDHVKTNIEEWRNEFDSLQLHDNTPTSILEIIQNVIQQNPTTSSQETDFECQICKRAFISEDEHFDLILLPYLNQMLSPSASSTDKDEDEYEYETIFQMLSKKLGIDIDNLPDMRDEVKSGSEYTKILREAENYDESNKNSTAQTLKLCQMLLSETEGEGDNDQNVIIFEFLVSLATKVFENDLYSLGESYKSILQTFVQYFSHSSTIHRFWLDKLKGQRDEDSDSMDTYHLILASLHYINNLEERDVLKFYHWSFPHLSKLLLRGVEEFNWELLGQILVSTNEINVVVLQKFLHQQVNSGGGVGEERAIILTIQGTVAKVYGNVRDALTFYDMALAQLSAVSSSSSSKKSIVEMIQEQFQDTHFHSRIMMEMSGELQSLGLEYKTHGLLDIQNKTKFPTFVPDLEWNELFSVKLREGYALSGGEALVAKRNEEGIESRMQSRMDKAFAYFDLSQGMRSSNGLITCVLTAMSFIIQEMKANEQMSLDMTYAYTKVIENFSCTAFLKSQGMEGPNMDLYVQRFILSALLQSSQILAQRLTLTPKTTTTTTTRPTTNRNPDNQPQDQDGSPNEKTHVEILSKLTKALMSQAMGNILTLTKIYPFINIGFQSVTDDILREYSQLLFLTTFIHKKNHWAHSSAQFPKHIYSYTEFDSVWRGWGNGCREEPIGFEEARLDAMESLLEAKGWDMSGVEDTMTWTLIRRTPAGWMDNEDTSLDFDHVPQNECFSRCLGFEITDTTGEIHLLLEQSDHGLGLGAPPPLFTMSDVVDIIEKSISDGAFTLENPDHTLNCHPFQEYSYWPKQMKDTFFLYDLVHADLFLKQITTGIEINSLAPFALRPLSEGFLQRLPQELQEKLVPVMERRRDPISKGSTDAHRFWIQADQVECGVEDTSGSDGKSVFKFGDVKLRVMTRLLSRKPNGEYEDEEDEEINSSAEAQLAETLTLHYDEIGQYFPILLRLKEMTKLCVIQKHLSGLLKDLKETRDGLEGKSTTPTPQIVRVECCVRECLNGYLNTPWTPPHPILSHAAVEAKWREILAQSGLIGKEGSLGPGEESHVRALIRTSLEQSESERFDFVADQIASLYQVNRNDIRPLILGWFNRDTVETEKLIQLGVEGKIRKEIKMLTRRIEGLEEFGIQESSPAEPLGSCGERVWVPASFCHRFKRPPLSPDPDEMTVDELEEEGMRKKRGQRHGKGSTRGSGRKSKSKSSGNTIQNENEKLEDMNVDKTRQQQQLKICEEKKKENNLNASEPYSGTGTGRGEGEGGAKSVGQRTMSGMEGTVAKMESMTLLQPNPIPSPSHANQQQSDQSNSNSRVKNGSGHGHGMKRKIAPPTLIRPPRVYGGVVVSASLLLLDLGLRLLPAGRVIKLGAKAYQLARKGIKTIQLAKKIVKSGGSDKNKSKPRGSGSVPPNTRPPGQHKDNTVHSKKGQVESHHLFPDAVGKQVGIPKQKGVTLPYDVKVHRAIHRYLLKVWKKLGTIPEGTKQQAPKVDPSNPLTLPRSVMAQSTNAVRNTLKSLGLYGKVQEKNLLDGLRMTKERFPDVFGKEVDPNTFKPPIPPK